MPDRTRLRETLRVEPGSAVRLGEIDPDETYGHDKASAKEALAGGLERLHDLQERLWAEQRHKVLVVLQGIDAAGKGGTIEHVMGAFNPAGCPVTSFKAPSAEELAHDYLWRVHRRVPAKGEIGVFNRSHYEDVLIVRVHELVPVDVWAARIPYAETRQYVVRVMGNLARYTYLTGGEAGVLPVPLAIDGTLRAPDDAF